MNLSLSRPLWRARKIAVCNVEITIDINFLPYHVYWCRYFEIYHKRSCVRSVREVYRRPFRIRRPLDDRKSNRRRIYMKRTRELFASLVFFIECSHSVLVTRFILSKVSSEFCYILTECWRLNLIFLKGSYLRNRIFQTILSFPMNRRKEIITYLTSLRKLFFREKRNIFLSRLIRDFYD